LNNHRDAIVASSTLSKVIRLEIEGGLREAISARKVVDRVHVVECVCNCRVAVRRGGRGLGNIVVVDEVKNRRGLGRSSGAAFSRGDVVAATGMSRYWNPGDKKRCSRGHSRVGRPIAVPTEGRRNQILGVDDGVKTMSGVPDAVLNKERKEKEKG